MSPCESQEEVLTSNEVLKLTALIYFKEALEAQAYENCAELIANAVKFGAGKSEIKDVIVGYLRGDKPGGQNEAKGKNRLGLT